MTDMKSKTVGFLALGHIGASMAERLLAPDIKLYVFDTRRDSPKEIPFHAVLRIAFV
jgi:3-hydroxyisobutyrate dehydrogenase-like beta-hydroxyacid dehydrogenase